MQSRVKFYGKVDQSNGARMRDILDTEFDSPLDLIMDDASHLYEPTKASYLEPDQRYGYAYMAAVRSALAEETADPGEAASPQKS